MKIRIISLTLIILSMFSIESKAQDKGKNDKKTAIVYYSHRDGNTRVVAEKIKKLTGGDLFRIQTEKSYPLEYNDLTAQAKKEHDEQARPKMKFTIEGIEKYDVIYVGYPNWWSTMPMVMFTFLESFDTEGKTIIPFCTHEGSRLGNSVSDIKKLCPKAKLLEGLAVRGGNVAKADADIERWFKLLK